MACFANDPLEGSRMWALAQIVDDFSSMPGSPMGGAVWWLLSLRFTTVIYFAFWLWMVWHCLRTDAPPRGPSTARPRPPHGATHIRVVDARCAT